jgi:hypothetical protein
LHKGITSDTAEEFPDTVDDWEGSVIQPFTNFINRVFSRSSTSIWLRLCLISRLAAPEVCAWVAIRSSAKDGSDHAESLAGSRASTPSTAHAEPLAGSRVGTPSTAGSRAESLVLARHPRLVLNLLLALTLALPVLVLNLLQALTLVTSP